MKRNYNILLLTLLLAFASCSFTTKTFEDPDKDKLLVQLITYVLEEGHFNPKVINDEFSQNVFQDYLNQIDPFKRYFYQSDIIEFEAYKDEIDDQIIEYDVDFFNITYKRLLERINDSKEIYNEILAQPFNYSIEEDFNTDYENVDYVKSKKDMKERWRKQLKFSAIANYHDLVLEQENESNRKDKISDEDLNTLSDVQSEKFFNEDKVIGIVEKFGSKLEQESRDAALRSLDELYDFIDDRERKDWFAVYINAIVEEFDPHTFYFAPEDKDRFDVAMSGNYEGIGARLQKRMDNIIINEVISGGPAWRQNKLEVGDIILKVRQEKEEEAVNVVGMRLADAIKFIKGPKGTKVILTP